MKIFNQYIVWGLLGVTISISLGCKKLIEIDPPVDKITPANVYNTDAGAASVISGIYSDLTFDGQIAIGISSIGFLTGLSADEVSIRNTNSDNNRLELYQNNLQNSSGGSGGLWYQLYGFIYRVNSAIDGIVGSKEMTPEGKTQLLGEAQFLRGFLYFYLVNLYGDVPLVISPNVIENSNAPRTASDLIYVQIVSDLMNAKQNLNSNYLNGNITTTSTERVRPNKAVASALLARVYLYRMKWANAETEATNVISNANYQLEPLTNVFKKSSREAIWQLQRTSLGQTLDADLYVPVASGIERTYYLSSQVIDGFEAADQRKVQWVYSYDDGSGALNYPYKYQNTNLADPSAITEYAMVFRLAEQYLIRSEARTRLGRITGANSAKMDLDAIRLRAGLTETTVSTQNEMLNAILKERKIELFTEWGHRWFDLKRSGMVDNVMTNIAPIKGGIWASYKALYPIPLSEIQKDPGLSGYQNPGY
jgi:starch-binding outer membrane protein, SusD/RagB family